MRNWIKLLDVLAPIKAKAHLYIPLLCNRSRTHMDDLQLPELGVRLLHSWLWW